MSDDTYYTAVRGCLEAARNGRFCAGAEDAAAVIAALQAEIAALKAKVKVAIKSYETILAEPWDSAVKSGAYTVAPSSATRGAQQ